MWPKSVSYIDNSLIITKYFPIHQKKNYILFYVTFQSMLNFISKFGRKGRM